MIIFNISGGLGNQFFQYALGRTLSLKHNVPLYLDFNSYNKDFERFPKLDYFNTQYQTLDFDKKNIYAKIYNSLHPFFKKQYRKDCLVPLKTYFTDKYELGFRKNIYQAKRGYFDGYWGNQNYFIENAVLIKKELTLKDEYKTNEFNALAEEANAAQSVAIHIRRGDYVQNEKFSKIFNVLALDYYRHAIDQVYSKVKDIKLFIFSDDIPWVKANLSLDLGIDHIFIDHQLGGQDYLEFSLMCECNHFIIANSTFSWWAAWLGSNKDSIVIAPLKWYIDPKYQSLHEIFSFIPKNWLLLE